MSVNGKSIKQVRVRHSARLEISTIHETFSLPLKNVNNDLIRVRDRMWPDQFVINLTDKAQIAFAYGASADLASDEYRKSVADARAAHDNIYKRERKTGGSNQ